MSSVHEISVRDEKGRVTTFRIQVGPGNAVSCWTQDSEGGAITAQELFSVCCRARAAKETGTR